MATSTLAPPLRRPEDVRSTVAPLRNGRRDPTTWVGPFELVRATHTPDGPGTLRVQWGPRAVDAEGWGPGASWLLGGVDALLGGADDGHTFEAPAHPVILAAQRDHPDVRFGASHNPYHELLPAIIAQRITSGEAYRQWRALSAALGDPAPGPFTGLRLPPHPDRLARVPTWWFHPLGIERKRAQALVEVARHADRLWEWSMLPPAEAAARLVLLRGVGEWTVGVVLGVAWGEPDAVIVGDYHMKNIVVHALTGRARGTDEEMCALLEPYRPQRGRVTRLLMLAGHGAPKFGPRRRILPMHRW